MIILQGCFHVPGRCSCSSDNARPYQGIGPGTQPPSQRGSGGTVLSRPYAWSALCHVAIRGRVNLMPEPVPDPHPHAGEDGLDGWPEASGPGALTAGRRWGRRSTVAGVAQDSCARGVSAA